jgi:hypothetical protein
MTVRREIADPRHETGTRTREGPLSTRATRLPLVSIDIATNPQSNMGYRCYDPLTRQSTHLYNRCLLQTTSSEL